MSSDRIFKISRSENMPRHVSLTHFVELGQLLHQPVTSLFVIQIECSWMFWKSESAGYNFDEGPQS